jgi:hypothetical protein
MIIQNYDIMIVAVRLIFSVFIGVTSCSTQSIARGSTHNPFTSCFDHGGIPTVLRCYRHCLRHIDVFYMIGHDPGTQKCYCCRSTPGIEDMYITGEGLQTYVTGSVDQWRELLIN